MISDSSIHNQTYSYFLTEAQDLLQTIEQNLLTLHRDRSPAKVHDLMRAAHTLKGAAGSVKFESMKSIAHSLEDIFKALYQPEVEIDTELESLLFEGYECLRLPLTTAIAGTTCQDAELLDRSETVFKKIRTKLGKHFDPGAALPTSAELGFDITQSLFEMGVRDRLEQLSIAVVNEDPATLAQSLQTQAEVFVGLAESLNLPGFGAIAEATLAALQQNPNRIHDIAQAALADFRQGQSAVLGGDRTRGGEVSEALQQLAGKARLSSDSSDSRFQVAKHTSKNLWHRLRWLLDRLQQSQTHRSAVHPELTNLENLEIFSLDPALEELTDQFDALQTEILSSEATNSGFEVWDAPPTQAIAPQFSKKETERTITTSARTTVRVNLEHLESVSYTTSELLIHQNQQTLQDEKLQATLTELLEQVKQHQQTLVQVQNWADAFFVSHPVARSLNVQSSELKAKFDSLELDRYNELHLLLQSAIGEVGQLEQKTEAIENLAQESQLTRSKQGRLLTNLRDDWMAARMTAIGTLLDRFPPVVQQLTATYSKPVKLQLTGTQVLVDKALVDQLYNPLLHLVRNAFDHGIESREVRRQHGKPAIGRIEICAYQQGNRTILEVRDDGRGLDFQRICQRGFELGLLSSNRVDRYSQTELLDVLFEPGFSTAQQISDLSGRGVGLDVVRSQIQSLQGTITVTSEPGQGTTFSLQLPLTLMNARLLVCQAGSSIYGLLSDEVERIVTPSADDIKVLASKRMLSWRHDGEEHPVPLYALSSLMSYRSWVAGVDAGNRSDNSLNDVPTLTAPILLLRRNQAWVGLEVDRILGEQELVIRPINKTIAPPDSVYGCSILGDGRLMLVVDGVSLLKRSLPTIDATPSPRLTVPAVAAPKQILVIDDSVTVRQTLALTLEKAGYTVIQAQDGLDAIAQLQQHPTVQLITCDIEMPRLNGFEFLMRYRQEPKLPQVPVMMLTSRSNAKHQQVAMQLGASAYLVKPFIEETLLQMVDQLSEQKVMP